MENVELIGSWCSPFYYTILWALELKSIKYTQIIQEGITNKSSLLLCQKHDQNHGNQVFIIHNGKTIHESLIILEYLEEKWPHLNPLLPQDPYERAMARFWAHFAHQKGLSIWTLLLTKGEDQAKAKNDILDMLSTIQDHGLKLKIFLKTHPFFGGDKIGIIDLILGNLIYLLQIIEDVVEVKILDYNGTHQRLFKWLNNFMQVPIIKKNLPIDEQDMFAFFKNERQKIMGATISM